MNAQAKIVEIPPSIAHLSANDLEALVNKGAVTKEQAIALLEQRAAGRVARGKKPSWPARHVIARLKGEPTPTDIRNAEKAAQAAKPVETRTVVETGEVDDEASQIAKLEAMLAKLRASAAEAAMVTKPRARSRARK